MAEYIVKGAEPNETVLHSRTTNGYDEWYWLPVRERIVRCMDCERAFEHDCGHLYCGRRPGSCFKGRGTHFTMRRHASSSRLGMSCASWESR